MIALVCLPGIAITLPLAMTLLLGDMVRAVVTGAIAAAAALGFVVAGEVLLDQAFRGPGSPRTLAINFSIIAMTAATLFLLRQSGFVFGPLEASLQRERATA
jgi:hypothetical protein